MNLARSLAEGLGRGLMEGMTTEQELEKDVIEANEKANQAYEDRNLAVIALAASVPEFSGYYYDEDDERIHPWPVVWAELPARSGPDRFATEQRRQVSWHVTPDYRELVEDVLERREPPAGWDGHDREEKNERLVAFARDA